ncbi:SprT family zinc-dependent metalloprotease [Rosenbergiella australiborealis]|uniref:Protein SprT n=1 Tax=Rosenbergiella australiborealis TaxID=1544696 RepID=A0ABS5T6A8_9GAMM|nr:SprT family zinc-dependent metalloprotease [Rosenbergiella australiborealis]MBT0727879.1 SprT family zinc-dependent metalloprotease [Rosenbergiella australiborealis]
MKTPSRLPIALQQALHRSLRHYLTLAAPLFETPIEVPTISWQQRGTTAGSAWLNEWQIRLNPVLALENQLAFAEQVIPHELAHLLVWKKFGRVAPHGREWRWMMEEVFGVNAERTHSFATTSVAGKTFAYHCQCQQHFLTLRRHNRVLRKETQYRCRRCGQPLQISECSEP